MFTSCKKKQQYFVMLAAADSEAKRHTWYLKDDIPIKQGKHLYIWTVFFYNKR